MVRFILPVRGFDRGKSRLEVPGIRTSALVESMFIDTVNAVLAAAVGPVVVVSPDEQVLDTTVSLGATPLLDEGRLNEAILSAVTEGRCAALLPDLPALTPAEIEETLLHESGFVPDHSGTGTTLVFGTRLTTRFGPDSARWHTELGLPRIDRGISGLTVDVDTVEDLRRAAALGLGPATEAALTAQGADPP